MCYCSRKIGTISNINFVYAKWDFSSVDRHDAVEAFCHLAFYATDGLQVITNLQGNLTGYTYDLTNPML